MGMGMERETAPDMGVPVGSMGENGKPGNPGMSENPGKPGNPGMSGNPRIILASASPRRRELLRQVGIEPEIEPSHVEEVISVPGPDQAVLELSRQKAEDIAARHKGEHVVIIGADTVVSVDGRILGKPKDEADAAAMLAMLQGRRHQVYTGVTILYCGESAGEGQGIGGMGGLEAAGDSRGEHGRAGSSSVSFAEVTDVWAYPMGQGQIAGYVSTGEPMDKAGAYGIQGMFAAYVKGISGDYNNVVGLPVGRVCQELMGRFGVCFW